MFTECLLTVDANQATLEICICTVENFNKVPAEMTKYKFPAYAFHKQKMCLRMHLIKPRSMKLRSFISRLQKLYIYLEEFPPDTEGQEIASLPAYEIMDFIYHSIPTRWKNKMIEPDFNYADSTIKEMTDFFETRVENLEPNENIKKSSAAAKKMKEKNTTNKQK